MHFFFKRTCVIQKTALILHHEKGTIRRFKTFYNACFLKVENLKISFYFLPM